MNKTAKETYYINGEFYTNVDIKNEIEKHIQNIGIMVLKEYNNEIWVYGNYKNAYCKIRLMEEPIYSHFEQYLKCVALDISRIISKRFFLKGDSNE